MNRTTWSAVAILVTGLVLSGCGAQEDAGPNSTGQADGLEVNASSETRRTPNATGQRQATFQSSTPKEAVSEFLGALQGGDKETTEALLTTKARQETEAHGLVVGPPGAGATYTIGQVEPVEGDENSAYVSCVWSEKEEQAEFEVVWILRKEEAGWRIAGMATRLGDFDEPVVLNFENLSELEQTMRNAEMAKRQQNNTDNNPAEKNTAANPHDQLDPTLR